MEQLPGWKVTRHAYGFDTAWEAVFGNGAGPVVGFNSESEYTNVLLQILTAQWTHSAR
jgi:hypothetical protein